MEHRARTKSWLAASGVALLVAALAVPAFAGAAGATPSLSTAAVTPATSGSWAYGGQGWSNGTISIGNVTESWTASFGWDVIFTATSGPNNVTQLEEQRTVGISVDVTYTSPRVELQYSYHADEADSAFANLTNDSTVYVNGSAVPALGIDNASVSVQGAITEALTAQVHTAVANLSASAFLNVSAAADASIQFAPSLGVIPLNLTGVTNWNSTSIATPAASWNISYDWADHGLNGTTGSGNGSRAGNWTTTGPVSLTGAVVNLPPPIFRDHKSRTAIVIEVTGGVDLYDGFILVPHAFDLFGGAAHNYDSASYGAGASISSGETLYLTPGRVSAYSLTAAQSTFGAATPESSVGLGAVSAQGPAASPSSPQSPVSVVGQPETVPAAQAESNCLTASSGCVGAAAGAPAGFAGLILIAAAVVAVIATVGVIEWRSYARRRTRKELVGGYGESWPNGVPPAAAAGRVPSAPMAPQSGPSMPDQPSRPL